MSRRELTVVRSTYRCYAAAMLLAGLSLLALPAGAQNKAKAAPAKPAAAAAKPAAKPSSTTTHPGGSASGHTATSGAGHSGSTGGAGKSSAASVKAPPGGSVHETSKGVVARDSRGNTTAFKGANGHEAKFDSRGGVKEVHANGMTVRRGPGGMRRTEVERADHSRLVADGHGRGYIQRPYSYGGHAYYSRAYYYHGGYYNAYYRGYYYNGAYLNGYMPAYYYPSAYYGWAYNPWPAPVAYGWGWGASPWVGYYGAYFAPYPVYPSAAFWLTDYLVAASLANAYAAAAASQSAQLRHIDPAHLVYASYDPATGTTSPTMTKEVKDAVSEEIKRELAAQKAQGASDATPANLGTLLADGQPHVFVASAGLTVTSAGQDCGLTEGDVLALNAPPAKDATGADLRVLASKQTDCAKGNVVSVELTDLQDMQNNLLANIDKGMKEMKDNPGKGGLPAPPADAVQGTKEAPYAAAAPAADPNGAAELDQQAKEGAQVEQQVVAEAKAPDDQDTTAQASPSPIGGVAAPAAPTHTGPITIALGQTPAQVIENKGQPTNKVNFPNKVVYIYPDMKITFVAGKVSDVN